MTNLKILVVGQGGREHALVKALKESPSVPQVHCAPGSSGMAKEALCHPDKVENKQICELSKNLNIDLVVIGPEAYLAKGLADELRQAGIDVFGPNQTAAQLEASKIFAKKFMVKAGVPTAPYVEVRSVEQVESSAHQFTPPYVLKADGLAAGKGVFICHTKEELLASARKIFLDKILGSAGQIALLEQFQPGWELSYLILTNGVEYNTLPLAQDHKRLNENDQGPNTGGMGAVAPLQIPPVLDEEIKTKILGPIVTQLKSLGIVYRGILYVGIMVTDKGPSVLEFNVRFGDPEAQVLLPLLDGDWSTVMKKVAQGELPEVKWKPLQVACVVLAAPKYPEQPQKNVPIEGDITYQTASSYFLHAGTAKLPSGHWVTNGGRVLNAVGIGNTRQEALVNAYAQAKRVSWPHQQIRMDIGKKS